MTGMLCWWPRSRWRWCVDNPLDFRRELQLDHRVRIERLIDECRSVSNASGELFSDGMQIERSKILANVHQRISTRDDKTDEVEPATVRMNPAAKVGVVVNLRLAIKLNP